MGDKRYLTVQADYHKVLVPVDDIMYITIENRKAKITKKDGSTISTNRSLREILGDLPQEEFSNVNRGIIVAARYVKSEKGGVITMKNGTKFKRRVRSDRAKAKPKVIPKTVAEALRRECPSEELGFWLGAMPMPVCVLELVYQNRAGTPAFLVRYCNSAMERLEGVLLENIKDQSVAELKGIGKGKWLTVYADVAINGANRMLDDVWDDGSFLRLHCYQPQGGFCVLVLEDLTRENNLVQKLFQRRTKG